jgi:dTMP kinase
MNKKGSFVVFEGLDRSGKDTQVDFLVKHLGDKAIKVTFPNEATEIGRMCRRCVNKEIDIDDQTLHLLFIANMTETAPFIEDMIEKGVSVICSRYYYSAIAYSIAKGLNYAWCRDVTSHLLEPHLLIYISVDPEVASKREGYGEGRYEVIDFQRKVRDSYNKVIEEVGTTITCLSSSEPIDKLHSSICDLYNCIRISGQYGYSTVRE